MNDRRLDPDELARLEEERDHLLASLEDPEREHLAGDLDDVDHTTLREDYRRRAADVLAAIEDRRSFSAQAQRPRSPRRTLLVTGGVAVLAIFAGVLVAQASGQRGRGPITGAIDTPRARLATCQQASFQDPEGGIECYDDILADAPDNVEALTYQGWALIRTEQIERGAQNLARAEQIDPEYPDVRVFRAIVASRAGEYDAAAQEIDRFYANDPTPAAQQVLASQGLEREIFIQTLDDASRECWRGAAQAQDPDAADASAFLADLRSCLDRVLAARPDDVDALVSRAYASVGPDDTDIAEAIELAQRAVTAGPEDPNARILSGSLALADGRLDDARRELDRLAELPRPTASFLLGDPERLASSIDDAAEQREG